MPAAHKVQAASEVLPVLKLYVPLGHKAQAVLPVLVLNVPVGQGVHVTAVAPPVEKEPIWQGPVP